MNGASLIDDEQIIQMYAYDDERRTCTIVAIQANVGPRQRSFV